MKFIHAYGPIPIPTALIVEELATFGFNRVSRCSEDFSAFSISLTVDSNCTGNESIQIKCIDGAAVVDIADSKLKFPLKRGFLAKSLKAAQMQLAFLHEIQQFFQKIDNSFPTLVPERHSSTPKRSIFVGRGHAPISVVFENPSFRVDEHCGIGKHELFAHLQALLSPPATATFSMSEEDECGICYSDFLDGHLADVKCTSHGCGHAYHRTCLLSWFKANPSCQCQFNYYTGPCLFCEQVSAE